MGALIYFLDYSPDIKLILFKMGRFVYTSIFESVIIGAGLVKKGRKYV